MGHHRQILLANTAYDDQHTIAGYEARGGYQSIKKALRLSPQKVIDEIKKAGLRGRGGAGYPTGNKLGLIPKNSKQPVFLMNNADEGEMGSFKDRFLLEKDPHAVIEGMLICAWAVQSPWSVHCVRGEYTYAYMRMKQALNEAYRKGYLGDNIFGSGFSHHMVLHRGAGSYVCGEETALIEALEGHKPQPRLKPPYYPVSFGMHSCPTLVNNTETFANFPWILKHGADAFRAIGTQFSPGTKLISASGHINKPGVYEVEMGYSINRFIEEECAGVWQGKKLKAVIPGGASSPLLRAEDLRAVTLDYESLEQAGSALGSAGFMVFSEDCDMTEVAHNIARFYAHESCGKCTPCREGSHWIEKIFKRITEGQGRPQDLELLESISRQIAGHTVCALGDALALPARAFLRKFPEEFKARIKDFSNAMGEQ